MTDNTPSTNELDARFRALSNQRNGAMDECVLLAGEIARLNDEVARLKGEIVKLTPPPAVEVLDSTTE